MKRSGRSRAIAAGSVATIAVGVGALLALFAIAGSHPSWAPEAGPLAIVMFFLPGTLLLGLIFDLPIAAAHVFFMTWLSQHFRAADSVVAWTLAGPLFSSPLIATLAMFADPGAPPYGVLFGVGLGLVGGLAAGLNRPVTVR